MAFYVVNHKVNDYNTWKKVYDSFETTRNKFGVKEHFAFQSVDDANHVSVVGEGKLEDIQKFLHSDDLKNGMADAGIAGAPQIFIGENKK